MKSFITVLLIACSLSLFANADSGIGLHLNSSFGDASTSSLNVLSGIVAVPTFQIQDTVPETAQDTVPKTTQDTVPTTTQDTVPAVVPEAAPDSKADKKAKRKDEFKIYAGVNFSSLAVSSDQYTSESDLGYVLGFKYKRGKFFYWEVGAQFATTASALLPQPPPDGFEGILKVSHVDIPINVGINILSVTSRIVGLRVFAGVSPSFITSVKDNDYDFTKDDINSFILYGQGGIGVDVLFLFLEVQYSYGFSDMIKKDNIKSNPSNFAITLGFRF